MAAEESSTWLTEVLDWLANDVVQGVIDAAAEIINRSARLADMIARETQRLMEDVVSLMTFVLKAIQWMANLLAGLVLGFREMMDDDLEADLFTSAAPAFWSGLVLFENIVGSTPLAVLNVVALGMLFFGVLWWTIIQFARMGIDIAML
jgi:hypothetical protein